MQETQINRKQVSLCIIFLTSLNQFKCRQYSRFFWTNPPHAPLLPHCCGMVPAFLSMAQLLLDAARTAHCG